MHDGEVEALAYLEANSEQDMCFVSADGPAIQAVAMLDLRDKAISLFEALQACGYTKPLPKKHRPEFVRKHLETGSLNRIRGTGLSDFGEESVHLRNVAGRFYPSASRTLAERDGMTPAVALADVDGHLRDLTDLLSSKERGNSRGR